MEEKYKDEDWLRKQYEEKERTQADIGEECGVSFSTISRWIRRHNIKESDKGVTRTCKECGEKFEVLQCRVEKGGGKFCSKDCADKYHSQKIKRQCKECGKEFKRRPSELKNSRGKFCSHSCAAIHRHRETTRRKESEARENPPEWSNDIAYLVGLITSDGNLSKGGPVVKFVSKNKNLVKQVREIAEENFNINRCKIADNKFNCWEYRFTSRKFYYFLENIGLMPNKSLRLGELNIPDAFFCPWVRGEVDGDGGWWTQQGNLRLEIYSASKSFLDWMNSKIKKCNLTQKDGNFYTGDTIYRLRYLHKDSKSIAKAIYKDADYYLERKYNIVEEFI